MVDDGAEVVNITVTGADAGVVRALVEKIQEISNVPLRLESSDTSVVECFKRYYNGVPL